MLPPSLIGYMVQLWLNFPGSFQAADVNCMFFLFRFFKIVMEYCGAGSVSDIMRLRRKVVSVFYYVLPLVPFSEVNRV